MYSKYQLSCEIQTATATNIHMCCVCVCLYILGADAAKTQCSFYIHITLLCWSNYSSIVYTLLREREKKKKRIDLPPRPTSARNMCGAGAHMRGVRMWCVCVCCLRVPASLVGKCTRTNMGNSMSRDIKRQQWNSLVCTLHQNSDYKWCRFKSFRTG